MRLTHIGGPTVLIEVAGWRLLTDPTFDPPGQKYEFGWGTSSVKLAGPARPAAEVGPIDAVLLTHDHHADNLDPAGRALLPSAGAVVTTASGAKRLGNGASGLEPWGTTTLQASGKPTLEVTATPCRHGPPLSRPVAGDVIGFALRWEGQEHGVLWISGDTVFYEGVREVCSARRRCRPPPRRRRPVPGHWPDPLHDDREGRCRAVPAGRAAHRHPGPLRGLEALPPGAARRSSKSSRGRRMTSARAFAGCRSARRSSSRRRPSSRRRDSALAPPEPWSNRS